MTVEEDLRAAFARHEAETPPADQLRDKIRTAFVRRKRRRAITASAAAVLAVAVALPIGLTSLRRAEPPPAATNLLAASSAPAPVPADGLNVLLISTDRDATPARSGKSARTGKPVRAATVLIVHVAADLRRAYLVSLPRTGAATVSKQFADSYRLGGSAATRAAVTKVTGVTFDAVVTVGPKTIAIVTDVVGGVRVCAEPDRCRLFSGADVVKTLSIEPDSAEEENDRARTLQGCLRALATRTAATDNPDELRKLLALAQQAGAQVNGDLQALTKLALSMRAADVLAVGAPRATKIDTPTGDRGYAGVGPSLYSAIRSDDLATWTVAHPAYLLEP